MKGFQFLRSGMAKAATIFSGANPDMDAKAARQWLESRGVTSLPVVPLQADELDKVTDNES
jgi:hypothetical protein